MAKHSSFYDQPDSFGWISITLHWTTSIAIVALWIVGQSIMSQPAEGIDPRRSLHIALGLIAWLPLAGRIVWRLRVAHPHVTGQTRLIHQIARITHYLILAALSVMIISGPVLAWALPDRRGIANVAGLLHANAATILLVLVAMHVLGALKHLMFNDDETVARIFLPRRNKKISSAQKSGEQTN